jgi:hypothetical protein
VVDPASAVGFEDWSTQLEWKSAALRLAGWTTATGEAAAFGCCWTTTWLVEGAPLATTGAAVAAGAGAGDAGVGPKIGARNGGRTKKGA